MVRPIPHVKYMRTVYPYIPVSDNYVNFAWTISKPITIRDIFTTGYLSCRGYYNLYMFRHSVYGTAIDSYEPPPPKVEGKRALPINLQWTGKSCVFLIIHLQ